MPMGRIKVIESLELIVFSNSSKESEHEFPVERHRAGIGSSYITHFNKCHMNANTKPPLPIFPRFQTIAALLPGPGLGMTVAATSNVRILAYSFSYSSPTAP